ncbi:MAG: TetR/AcrR family transcriptional regulator [Acidobacteriota bacterium]|nr:TetR/AcrR family transcriptional regulator [Acidobacteriota bacterium]
MQKNKERTRSAILAAVGSLLAREGFRNLGINAVAREAAVDKVLIYRYFGGMEDLLKAYAAEGDFWPSSEELMLAIQKAEPRTDAELAGALLIEFGRALRRRPVTQEILRWELLERNELTDTLARYREEEGMKLLKLLSRNGADDLDLAAIGSLLAAGQTYLILRSRTVDVYNGLKLDDEQGWERLEDAIRKIVALAFSKNLQVVD